MAQKRIAKLFSRAREAMAPALDALDAHRELIAQLQEERQAVAQARRPRAEAEAAAQAQIEELGRSWAPSFAFMASPGAHIAGVGEAFRLGAKRDPLGFAAAIMPGQLLRAIGEGLDAAYAHGDGLPEAVRAQRLDALGGQLRTAELEEESIIRGLEAAGIPAFRRPNANPEIVLCDDSELPE